MKHIINTLMAPFRKAQLTGYLIRGGRSARVKITKVSLDQSIIILYAMIERLEAGFKVDRRYIMKKVLELDTAVKKDHKRQEKEVRQQVYKSKNK